jgi:hypothetical protein
MSGKTKKLRPSEIKIDARFQRDLDESRAKRMSKALDPRRLGHPVVSARADGTYVCLDGQHRLKAMLLAGMDEPILCDVWEGLTLEEESALFLMLQEDRRPVRVFDKFKARIVAQDPVAVEIRSIVQSAGLRISKAQSAGSVAAIQALESVHRRYANLGRALTVLKHWSDGDGSVYDGRLIRDVGYVLAMHPELDLKRLAEKLSPHSPERILNRISRRQGTHDTMPRGEAALLVFLDIYNFKLAAKDRVRPKKAA